MRDNSFIRRLLGVTGVLAALVALWLMADALRASRIPHSGRPLETTSTKAAYRPPPAPSLPQAVPTPTQTNARLAIDWEDVDGNSYRSELTLEPDTAHPLTASVITRDHANNQELVRYRAEAHRDANGTLFIDATSATVSGALSGEWMPDSFTIAGDGRVATDDAQSPPGHGWVVQEDAFTPGK